MPGLVPGRCVSMIRPSFFGLPQRSNQTMPEPSSSPVAPRERLIVALDLSSLAQAEKLVADIGEAVSFYKIGYQLGFNGGLDFARDLVRAKSRPDGATAPIASGFSSQERMNLTSSRRRNFFSAALG